MTNFRFYVFGIGLLLVFNVAYIYAQLNCQKDRTPDNIDCPPPPPTSCSEGGMMWELKWENVTLWDDYWYPYEQPFLFVKRTSAECGGRKSLSVKKGPFGPMVSEGSFATQSGSDVCYSDYDCTWVADGKVGQACTAVHATGPGGECYIFWDNKPQYKCERSLTPSGNPLYNITWRSASKDECEGGG